MESEIATIQYVAANTSVPLPKVFGCDLSVHNGVSGPYMFMELVNGEALKVHFKKQRGIWGNEVRHVLRQMVQAGLDHSTRKFDSIGGYILSQKRVIQVMRTYPLRHLLLLQSIYNNA